jgi:hypothetical protein
MFLSSRKEELGNPTLVLMILVPVVRLPLNFASLSFFKQQSFWMSTYPKVPSLFFTIQQVLRLKQ